MQNICHKYIFMLTIISLYKTKSSSSTSCSKVAIVTGSNKGIGYATVKALCGKFCGDVYLTSRDESRGRAAIISLNKLGYNPKFRLLDITDRDSIENLKNFLEKKYGGIDVLVNNAAIAFKVNDTEPFSLQAKETVRVNYFGIRKVCEILYPIIKPHARIVHVTSAAGHLSKIPGKTLREKFASESLKVEELDNLINFFVKAAEENRHEQEGWPNNAYVVSKVGVSKLAFIHQQEFSLKKNISDVVVNAVHPGYVATDMSSYKGPLTTEEGAVSSVYAALLPLNIDKPKGAYLWCDKKEVNWVEGPLP